VYRHLTRGGTLATANQRCIGSWAEDQTGPASLSNVSDAICISCKALQIARDRNLVWLSCAPEKVWADDDTIAVCCS
jgi:hypothetical protein